MILKGCRLKNVFYDTQLIINLVTSSLGLEGFVLNQILRVPC